MGVAKMGGRMLLVLGCPWTCHSLKRYCDLVRFVCREIRILFVDFIRLSL